MRLRKLQYKSNLGQSKFIVHGLFQVSLVNLSGNIQKLFEYRKVCIQIQKRSPGWRYPFGSHWHVMQGHGNACTHQGFKYILYYIYIYIIFIYTILYINI